MNEMEQTVKNLAAYVASTGSLMLEPLDISDIIPIPGDFPHYYKESDFIEHVPVITGIVWSFKENGVFHYNMLFPSIDQWVRWLSEYFLTIEILPCKEVSPPVCMPRRMIICRDKRASGDLTATRVINQDFIVTDKMEVKFITAEEKAAIVKKRNTPPRIIDLPFSYLISKMKPWTRKFWQTIYIISKEKIRA